MNGEAQTNPVVWTIGRLLRWTTDYLARSEVEEPRLAAELLLAHALNCPKIELYTRFDNVPDEPTRATLRTLVRRAAEHAPIAYLIGHKEFYSLGFEVTPAVLIPRPETETLVDRAIDHCRSLGEREVRFVDVGTGSGCIAVAVLSQVPRAVGVGTDISADALQVARRNAERHQVADRLTLLQIDGLDLPPAAVPAGGFDVLVSNPPYVADAQFKSLPRNVREHEPRAALSAGPGGVDGADGADGLAFYRLFAARASEILAPGGSILVEIGYDQREAVVGVFARAGRYSHVGTWRDPGGQHERVVQFRFEKG
jgi:release factor glutamine methyltransferase